MHFLYVFILQFCATLHVSNDQLCTNHALHGLYRAADTVNHELLMMNEMVFRNM